MTWENESRKEMFMDWRGGGFRACIYDMGGFVLSPRFRGIHGISSVTMYLLFLLL